MQELFQIHGASAAIVSKKTLLHYGKYHNIHFSNYSIFLLDAAASFYIKLRMLESLAWLKAPKMFNQNYPLNKMCVKLFFNKKIFKNVNFL